MYPWCSIRATEQGVGLVVIYYAAFFRVPFERSVQLHGNVGEDTTGAGDVAFVDVRHRQCTVIDSGQEVSVVSAKGRGHMTFEVFLRFVFVIKIRQT